MPHPPRRRHRASGGQSLVLFALMALVIFGSVGLAVDAGLSFMSSGGEERAAAAAALAGVPYMPDDFTDANQQALAAASRNGYTDGDSTGGRNVDVTVSKLYDGGGNLIRNELQVTVSENVQTTFLRLLSFGAHRVSRTSTAIYLRPLQLGQPGSQLGGTVSTVGNGQYYMLSTEGWAVDRGNGDAFAPNPNPSQSNSNCSSPKLGTSTDVHALSASRGALGAPDSGLPQRGGYSYRVVIPAGQRGVIQVYSPVEMADDGYAATSGDPFGTGDDYCMVTPDTAASHYSTMSYTVFQVNNQFVRSQDTRLSQMLAGPARSLHANGQPGTYIDVNSGRTITQQCNGNALGSGNGNGAADYNQICNNGKRPSNMLAYHNWVTVTAEYNCPAAGCYDDPSDPNLVRWNGAQGTAVLSPGTYRVRVDALDNQGRPDDPGGTSAKASQLHKGYSVRVVGPADGQGNFTTCAGCTVGAWNDMSFFTPIRSGGFNIPMVSIPPEYAGQTVTLDLYDPGDVSGGANTISIVDPGGHIFQPQAGNTVDVYDLGIGRNVTVGGSTPACSTGREPCLVGHLTTPSVSTIGSGTNIYNGKWLRFQIPVPATYSPGTDPNGWYWSLQYSASNANDNLTAAVSFGGTPVHLLP